MIQDRADYEFARDVVARHELAGRDGGGPVLAGARRARLEAARGLDPRGSPAGPPAAAAHKFIWGADVRGV